MKRLFLVWNTEMTECVGFLDEGDAIYASIGDRAASETYPSISSLAHSFRESYAEGVEDYDYDSILDEDVPEDLVTLPMTDIEIED